MDYLKEYASRSDAASAIVSGQIVGGSVFAANGLLYKYGNQGSAFIDLGLAGVMPYLDAMFDHYGDDDDTRLVNGILALNAGEIYNIYGSGNTYRTSTTFSGFPLITAENFEIQGRQSMIIMRNADARVFRIGDASNFVRRAVVEHFQITATNTQASGACIELENVTDVLINNVDPNSVPQYLKIKGGQKSAAVTVQDSRGSWRSGLDLSPIELQAGSVIKLHRLDIQSPDAAPTARSILVRPQQVMDTLEIEQCKIYARDGIGGGLDVDLTDYSVTNIWVKNNTFDRCVNPCIRIYAGGNINNWSKHLIVAENYVRCMGDYTINIENAGNNADVEGMNIRDNIIGAVGRGAIRVAKTNTAANALMRSLRISGNIINDDIQYVETVTQEAEAVMQMSVLNGFEVGQQVKLDGFVASLSFLNGQSFEVKELMPDGRSIRLKNCNTTSINTSDNQAGRITSYRDAHILTNVEGSCIAENVFTARVDSVPTGVTTAAIDDQTTSGVLEGLNSVVTPAQLFL